jgi:uncharacterized repeat protein (TIGR03837 family)
MIGNCRWDIFCRVVDNYGDIGVCWRLSRQLAHEHGLQVRLWVDDLNVAKRLISSLDIDQPRQEINGVEICEWREDCVSPNVADVVIEAFGCGLPDQYMGAMASKESSAKSIWINLEYLSAEPWITHSHLLSSPHAQLPLISHFFFPGFDPDSGGLIREHDLIEARDAFLQSDEAQTAFWKKLSVTKNLSLKISLFSYPHAPLQSLLEAISTSSQPTMVFVPDSSALIAIGEQLGIGRLVIGDIVSKGNLTLHVLPFLSQEDYDRLLWACDINFVRGEDSWVRALWAGKPMIWQPYRQEEDAHLIKLQAFLNVYSAGLSLDRAQALQQLHLDWCNSSCVDAGWPLLLANMETLHNHAQRRSAELAEQPDLAAKLVIFSENFSK